MRIPAVLLLLGLTLSESALAQTSVETLWTQGKYDELLDQLLQRREGEYGRAAETDYLIAMCLCRLPARRAEGIVYFEWILRNYDISQGGRQILADELKKCRSSTMTVVAGTFSGLGPRSLSHAVPGAGGKIIHYPEPGGAFFVRPTEVTRVMDPSIFAKRIAAFAMASPLQSTIQEVAGEKARVSTSAHFVVTAFPDDKTDLEDVGRRLEKAADFFARKYGLSLPEGRIAVYLLPARGELDRFAAQNHGLRLANGTIGYSFMRDHSISAVARVGFTTTLYHELTHLMLHKKLGDAPPWLDEGLAALYEQVSPESDVDLKGVPNWRGNVLQLGKELIPKLKDLLQMDWRSFENADADYEGSRQTVNAATARYFMLFLQDRWLTPLVRRALSDRRPGGPSDLELLSAAIGPETSLDDLQKQFDAWLKKTVNL